MPTIRPVPRALVPVDSAAAVRVTAPNYDEFQSDREIWELLQRSPDSVLAVTMAHCDAPAEDEIGPADSAAALEAARRNMRRLSESPLTREAADLLFVYEISGGQTPGRRQVGLGGMASTAEIRTPSTPEGPIIRNEGIREPKARGRAKLISETKAVVGTVNIAIPDDGGVLAAALEAHADAGPAAFEVRDAHENLHRVWPVSDPALARWLQDLLAGEPEAYVADGNHRSAAAAMLGYEGFLAVFFPIARMGISPYNRLVRGTARGPDDLVESLETAFGLDRPGDPHPFQPSRTHEIGLYGALSGWLRLRPRADAYDPTDAAASIDHAIVQRHVFGGALGIDDPADERLRFVGADRDAAWLQDEVDAGRAAYAVTLPAVTIEQFVRVCRQNRMMPPKSTWFEPKIRSGLVIALLD